jgi:putative protease
MLSAKDLKLIEHLHGLRDAGVCSFKIEGRSKSIFYLAVVTRAYRLALDALENGRALDPELAIELERVTRRGYHAGFLSGSDKAPSEEYRKTPRGQDAGGFLGRVVKRAEHGAYRVDVRGKIVSGTEIEAMSPLGTRRVRVAGIRGADDSILSEAHGGVGEVTIDFKEPIDGFSLLRTAT